jgi:hypothetical protein
MFYSITLTTRTYDSRCFKTSVRALLSLVFLLEIMLFLRLSSPPTTLELARRAVDTTNLGQFGS